VGGTVTLAAVHGGDVAMVVLIFVLLAASGFLALAETSMIRTSKVKAKTLIEEERRGARRLARLVEHPERFLNPVLLLVLICQLVAATLVGVLAARWFQSIGIVIATVFEVVVVFVVFEAIPKNYAVRHSDRAALFAAPVIDAVTRFPPVRWISAMLVGLADLLMGGKGSGSSLGVTESELLAMADFAHSDEAIEPAEREFIHSVIEFGDTVVREVMVPRPDMVTVDADETVTDALERGLAAGYSRLPVLGEDIDDVLGIAITKDLVRLERSGNGATPVRDATRNAMFVPETKRVATLLTEMQTDNVHLAVVVDEYGGTAGLVTLEDVLEELVGDIRDEFDREEPEVSERSDGVLVVSGRMSIDEVDELVDKPLPKGSWDTVGGLVYDLAGGVPEVGQVLTSAPFAFTIEGVEGRRIQRVRIEFVGTDDEDADER
jgi:putative hemolysin